MSLAHRVLSACVVVLASTSALAIDRYVAPSGDDANAGTLSAPLQTINRCAQLVIAGDRCVIRAGTYRETVRPANSGTLAAPIAFVSYPGETVTVSGADTVTNWTQHNGSVYRASVSLPVASYADSGFFANQVFVDGEMMIEARWPNTGSNLMRPTLKGGGVSSPSGLDAVVSNPDIPNIGEGWVGATVWTSEWYTMSRCRCCPRANRRAISAPRTRSPHRTRTTLASSFAGKGTR
jgi:hypothetical protein